MQSMVTGADFNGHVGAGNRDDEEVMGRFGIQERKAEGQPFAFMSDIKRRFNKGFC